MPTVIVVISVSDAGKKYMVQSHPVILLGEPDPSTSELYQRTLNSTFAVLVARQNDMVMHLLRTHQIAALVLEPTMFVEDSWEQLVITNRLCAEHDIPLVICSTLDARRRVLDLGVTAYLVKPTLPVTLLAVVRRVLR